MNKKKIAGLLALVVCLAITSPTYSKINEVKEKQKIANYLVKNCGARKVDLSTLPDSAKPSRELTLAEAKKLKSYMIKIKRNKSIKKDY